MRLTVGALEQAIERRQPATRLMTHSDRGRQYARAEYIAILEKYHMILAYSRAAPFRGPLLLLEDARKTFQKAETVSKKKCAILEGHACIQAVPQ